MVDCGVCRRFGFGKGPACCRHGAAHAARPHSTANGAKGILAGPGPGLFSPAPDRVVTAHADGGGTGCPARRPPVAGSRHARRQLAAAIPGGLGPLFRQRGERALRQAAGGVRDLLRGQQGDVPTGAGVAEGAPRDTLTPPGGLADVLGVPGCQLGRAQEPSLLGLAPKDGGACTLPSYGQARPMAKRVWVLACNRSPRTRCLILKNSGEKPAWVSGSVGLAMRIGLTNRPLHCDSLMRFSRRFSQS
jgi:hypothetical protein